MAKALVRAEARRLPLYADQGDWMRETRALLNRFKRLLHENDIPHQVKIHERFVRPCDKRRQQAANKRMAIRKAKEKGQV